MSLSSDRFRDMMKAAISKDHAPQLDSIKNDDNAIISAAGWQSATSILQTARAITANNPVISTKKQINSEKMDVLIDTMIRKVRLEQQPLKKRVLDSLVDDLVREKQVRDVAADGSAVHDIPLGDLAVVEDVWKKEAAQILKNNQVSYRMEMQMWTGVINPNSFVRIYGADG